ncbi:MAG: hypothetical protein QXE78_01960 [Nitrososphaeria archaeon]
MENRENRPSSFLEVVSNYFNFFGLFDDMAYNRPVVYHLWRILICSTLWITLVIFAFVFVLMAAGLPALYEEFTKDKDKNT